MTECRVNLQLCGLATDSYVINIIRMIKSRKIRWAGHVERMLAGERCIKVFLGGAELEGKDST